MQALRRRTWGGGPHPVPPNLLSASHCEKGASGRVAGCGPEQNRGSSPKERGRERKERKKQTRKKSFARKQKCAWVSVYVKTKPRYRCRPSPKSLITRAEFTGKLGKSETVGVANAPTKVQLVWELPAQTRSAPGCLLHRVALREAATKAGTWRPHNPTRRVAAQTPQSPPLPARRTGPSIKLTWTLLRTAARGQSEPSSAAMSSAGWLPIGWLY